MPMARSRFNEQAQCDDDTDSSDNISCVRAGYMRTTKPDRLLRRTPPKLVRKLAHIQKCNCVEVAH